MGIRKPHSLQHCTVYGGEDQGGPPSTELVQETVEF
jgi:hypothetical protein